MIIVYTMGRVGTFTVRDALEQNGLGYIHAHYMMSSCGEWEKVGMNQLYAYKTKLPDHLYNTVREEPKKHKVITLVRDPIIRNISAFLWTYNNYNKEKFPTSYHKDHAVQFVKQYRHSYCLAWYDLEFYPFMDFDIYSQPFNYDRGYQIYDTPYCDLLVLRTESLDWIGAVALKDFLGIDAQIKRTNQTTGKPRGVAYDGFISKAKFPVEFVQEMYNSKFSRHFLSSSEREKLMQRWS